MVERKKTGLRKARAAVSHLAFTFLYLGPKTPSENLGQAVEYSLIDLFIHHIMQRLSLLIALRE